MLLKIFYIKISIEYSNTSNIGSVCSTSASLLAFTTEMLLRNIKTIVYVTRNINKVM